MRVATKITLNEDDRATLERWAKGRSTSARLVLRARIVLAAAEGKENRVKPGSNATPASPCTLFPPAARG